MNPHLRTLNVFAAMQESRIRSVSVTVSVPKPIPLIRSRRYVRSDQITSKRSREARLLRHFQQRLTWE